MLVLAAQSVRAAGETKLSLDALIEKLSKEGDLSAADHPGEFVTQRPHPLLEKLELSAVPQVLTRLGKPMSKDPAVDVYVRYHLAHLLISPAKPPEGTPKALMAMANTLPVAVPFESKPVTRYEPPDIANRYRAILKECQVTVGFPPFQKEVGPPASFEYMDAGKRKKCEALWEEAKGLQGKFKTIKDPQAQVYNKRAGALPILLRQLRGDVVLGMIMSGEPSALEQVTTRFAETASTNYVAATDELLFINAAYIEGWFGQYDAKALRAASQSLRNAVTAADKQQKVRWQSNGYRMRNLSESAFTLITALSTGKAPERGTAEELPQAAAAARKQGNVTPQTLDLPTIDAAIRAGVTYLQRQRPPLTFFGANDQRSGDYALAAWAMRSAGESHLSPSMRSRINWVATQDSPDVFDIAMRLQLLGKLPYSQWDKWVQRDATWLGQAMTDKGSFAMEWLGEPDNKGFGDNANSQYAALGFWAADRAGFAVDNAIWKQIDQYWRAAQFPVDGENGAGWAVRSHKAAKPDAKDFGSRVAAPMTAGGVLSLSLSERYLLGPTRLGVGNKKTAELSNGIRWLDRNFAITDLGGDSDFYYYMWTIQNVGQATGYRTFNKIDWFREATAKLVNQQAGDGSWKGPKGPIVSTSFAVLYLSAARGPLAVCKVRFDADKSDAWNNRPDDLVNFAGYVSKTVEAPTSWQICDLDQPVYELIESPLLYLATDKAFEFNEQQVSRLKEYIDAGGLLVMAPEGGNLALPLRSMKELAAKLLPGEQMQKIDRSHPFYSCFQAASPTTPISVIGNGVRPLVAVVEKDISRDLQADSEKNRDSFNLLANLYLYATGLDTRRPRIQTHYVALRETKFKRTLNAARVKYAGRFDPEPGALGQLQAIMGNTQQIDLRISVATPDELKDQQVAFLTAGETSSLSDAEATALRKWVDAGGTLWIDAAGGGKAAVEKAEVMVAKMKFSPAEFKPLEVKPATPQGTVFRTFNIEARPSLAVASIGDRPAVYFSTGDITSGLAGASHWQISGLTVPAARQEVANSLLKLK